MAGVGELVAWKNNPFVRKCLFGLCIIGFNCLVCYSTLCFIIYYPKTKNYREILICNSITTKKILTNSLRLIFILLFTFFRVNITIGID